MFPISLYLHIPFCVHRCGYCDFNTYAGLEKLMPAYAQALAREVEWVGQTAGERLSVHSIYFGGGTPSLMPSVHYKEIFSAIHSSFDVQPGAEVTLEANPGTLTQDFLIAIRQLGVNRLSLGMQSVIPEELRLLDRSHGYAETLEGVRLARQAGFDNISLDLIYGLPHQELKNWQRSLKMALELKPQHLSLYSLTVEHGTPLEKLVKHGLLAEPDADVAGDMYEWSMQTLEGQGFVHYEISNWAKRDGGKNLESRHNCQYWLNQPYLGFGAGAHGFIGGLRTVNVLTPAAYIRRLQQGRAGRFPHTPATSSVRVIDRLTEMQETMMMGLRLLEEGVSQVRFSDRFGQRIEQVFGKEAETLVRLGLLTWHGEDQERLVLTHKGTLLGNQVFMEFV